MTEIKRVNPASLRIPTKSYSNGVVIPLGDAELMFLTGQVSQDIDGELMYPNNPAKQTRHIFSRIADILKDAGMSLEDIVKLQVFVTDIKESAKVSEVRDEVLVNSKPASTLVEVSNLLRPGYCVEIEAVAVKFGR